MRLTECVYLCCLLAKCFLVRHFTWLHPSAVPHALQGWHTSQDVHIFVLFMLPLPASWSVYIKYNHQRWHRFIWCLQKQQKHAHPAVTRCLTQILYLILYWTTAKLFSYFMHSTQCCVTKFQFPRSLKQRCHFEMQLLGRETERQYCIWMIVIECGRQKFQYVNNTKIIATVVIFPYKHILKTHWLWMLWIDYWCFLKDMTETWQNLNFLNSRIFYLDAVLFNKTSVNWNCKKPILYKTLSVKSTFYSLRYLLLVSANMQSLTYDMPTCVGVCLLYSL